jgi:hypothetical protein
MKKVFLIHKSSILHGASVGVDGSVGAIACNTWIAKVAFCYYFLLWETLLQKGEPGCSIAGKHIL